MAMWSDVAMAGVKATEAIATEGIKQAGEVKKRVTEAVETLGINISAWANNSVEQTKYRDYTTPIIFGTLILMIGIAYIIKSTKK